MAKQKMKVLRVSAKAERFRRAGFEFGRESVDLPIAKLKKGQLEALLAEPMLVAIEAEVELDIEDPKAK